MTVETFILLVALGIGSYRITRFFLFDTIIEGIRQHWYTWLVNRKHLRSLTQKLLELTSCTWCFGVHISWILLTLWLRVYPWQLGIHGWMEAFAIMGIQGFLHSIEPGESEN